MNDSVADTEMVENRTFEEIASGDTARLERRLSEHDIDLFAAVSGDLNPTHMCEEFAESSDHGRVIGHSMSRPTWRRATSSPSSSAFSRVPMRRASCSVHASR